MRLKYSYSILFLFFLCCNTNSFHKNIGLIRRFKKIAPIVLLLVNKGGTNEKLTNTTSNCLPDGSNCTSWLDCCDGTCLQNKCHSSQGAPCKKNGDCFNLYPYYNYTCQNIFGSDYCENPNVTGMKKEVKAPLICIAPCGVYTDCPYLTCLNSCCCSSDQAPCSNEELPCCLAELGLYKCINGKCEAVNNTAIEKYN